MADIQNLMRRYETLLKQKPSTFDESIELERHWIDLHQTIAQTMKTLSQRNRKLLNPFVKKSLEECKANSYNLFQKVLRKSASTLNSLMKQHKSVYIESGVKGLINIHLKQEKSLKTFDDYAEDIRKKEHLQVITEEDILREIDALLNGAYSTLDEARLLEQRVIYVYAWWKQHKEHVKKTKRELYLMKQFGHYHQQLSEYILKELRYEIELKDVLSSDYYVRKMQQIGIEELLLTLHRKKRQMDSVMQSLTKSVTILHPRDEFVHVRKKKRHFKLRLGETNSGKTGGALDALKAALSGLYAGPLRDLASEVYGKVTRAGIPCELITDETTIYEKGAQHRATVVEMCSLHNTYEVAVIDEIQYLADKVQGSTWLRLLYGLQANTIYLCGALHILPLLKRIIEECGDTYEVELFDRKTPLLFEDKPYLFPCSIEAGDALIVFSREYAMKLAEQIKDKGMTASVVYENLPYHARKAQLQDFSRGITEVLIATNTIGIGVNLPIRRVVFMETQIKEQAGYRPLTIQEVKQISGRAGRYGRFEKGLVNTIDNPDEIKNKLTIKEKPIEKSFISPSHELASNQTGTLRQRLMAWKEMPYEDTVAEKENIDEKLTLLRQVEKWEPQLGGYNLYRTLHVVFDSSMREVVQLWKDYVRQLAENKKQLTRPTLSLVNPHQYEVYFAQLMLYISFSKKFKIAYDKAWVIQEKQKTANAIHRGLKEKRYQYVASF